MKVTTHECVILLAMLKMMLKKALAREQWRLTTFLHFGDTMTPRSIFYLDRISYHGAKLSTFNNWLVPNCPVINCLTILKYKSQNCTLFVLIQGFIYWSPFPVVHFSNQYNVESPCFNELWRSIWCSTWTVSTSSVQVYKEIQCRALLVGPFTARLSIWL